MYIFQKIIHSLRVAASLIPLSGQGAIILFAAATSLHQIAIPKADLVIHLSSLFLVIFLCCLAILCGLKSYALKKRLQISRFLQTDEIISHQTINIECKFERCFITPGFYLDLGFEFDHPGVKQTRITISGQTNDGYRSVFSEIEFPHRGIWQQTKANLIFRDRFGLSAVSWQQPCNATAVVFPRSCPLQKIDYRTSTTIDGDINIINSTAKGDYYEYKEYSPADSFSKIMWKMFAKSGELFVRHPEPAASDIGKIAVYLVATKDEDYLAGATRYLLEQLCHTNHSFIFGTDGMFSHTDFLPTDLYGALQLMATTVWHPEVGTGKGFELFARNVLSGESISSFLVIGPQNRDWQASLISSSLSQEINIEIISLSINDVAAPQHVDGEVIYS